MAEIRIAVDQNHELNQIKNVVAHQVTTGARTTLGGTLTSAETGLFVMDVTDKNLYVWDGTAWVNATQVINSPMQIKGEIDASANPAFPATPAVGDVWIVTVAGTIGGETVEVGDQLVYSTSGWFIIQSNLVDASTTVKGYIRIATQAEVNAGTDNATAVTPLTLQTKLDLDRAKVYKTAIATLTANTPLTITHNLNLGNAQDYTYKLSDATGTIRVADVAVSVNSFTIETNKTYTGLRIVVQGL
ncbi:MAG: hypothetical protein KA146_05155 [Leptospiraceae bacterium]|mgnify:CR=1 FL=1|nr:hypothetical protein [Leptospiraceae bacterium]